MNHPLLYQINTRVWMTELSRKLGHTATLDDIPDTELDRLAEAGFDYIWFLSVWQTGQAGQQVSRLHPEWNKEFQETLPDLKEEDIAGSGFAITDYTVSGKLGGNEALSRLRHRLRRRGLKLMLDFVPNHTAIDHRWVTEYPDYFIRAGESEMEREPQNYIRLRNGGEERIFAHGRDPFFAGWPDTLQLNYGNPHLQEAMIRELLKISGQCDGVRCDMAMLVLPEVFERTWGIKCRSFWPEAIKRVRDTNLGFCFMAEVYWDLERTMLQNGFSYAYDKRLYDTLKEGHVQQVRAHFYMDSDYQERMARFLENHDEARVAAEFPPEKHRAAAIITFLSPGLRFFHQGQLAGRVKRISAHLARAPEELVNLELETFYEKLQSILRNPVFRYGTWNLIDPTPAWDGNGSNENFIAFAWHHNNDEKMLVIVNFSDKQSQCYIRPPLNNSGTNSWILYDLISNDFSEREGIELQEKGLYLDEPAWKVYVFRLEESRSDNYIAGMQYLT